MVPLEGTEQLASACLVSWVDSAHHFYAVGQMSTSLQETVEHQVRIAWSTIRLLAEQLKMVIVGAWSCWLSVHNSEQISCLLASGQGSINTSSDHLLV